MSTCNKLSVFVGTYTYGDSKGIYTFDFNRDTLKLGDIKSVATLGHPTYLTISKNQNFIYSVIKDGEFGGTRAFKIKNDNDLDELNTILEKGKSPCHLSTNHDSSYVFAGNYHEATIVVMPVLTDGSLGAPTSTIKHTGTGSGIVPDRQEKPHVHYSSLTPDEKYLAVTDLGEDCITFYPFCSKEGLLDEQNKKVIKTKPGAGPRHIIFHNELNYFYVINELTSVVDVYEYRTDEFFVNRIQSINALPEDFSGDNLGAAIRISPNGKFLYVSNRGADSIAIFQIDLKSGNLNLINHISTFGNGPRDFSFDASGEFLIAANQNSNSVILYKADTINGTLTKLDCDLTIPNPVCISIKNN